MGIKYYDTREGWLNRGYHVVKGELPIGTNRSGDQLYSWGQIVERVEEVYPTEENTDDDVADERTPRMGVIKPRKVGHYGNDVERKHESV